MSITMRTSPKETAKDAFGPGNGLSHEFGLAMGKQRVNPSMLKRAVSDPLLQAQMGALLRGESIDATVRIGDLVSRELAFLERFGISKPTEDALTNGYERMANAHGGVTTHDRYVPGDLLLTGIMPITYRFNELQQAAGEPALKLCHQQESEWWRTDKKVQHIRTTACIFRVDFGRLMDPTDLAGRPFNLTADEQEHWAKDQGGTGVTTAEEALYLAIRSVDERKLPPWGSGAFLRCSNAGGSGDRLTIGWGAGSGLSVGYDDLAKNWRGGALPEKSVAL